MLVSRGMLGLREGMHYPIQMKFVENSFPPLEHPKANSVWHFMRFVGPAITMLTFATGRGTPSRSPIAPAIKNTGNRSTFVNMRDNMDLDMSRILRANETVLQAGKRVFEEIIACASGKEMKAERLNQRDFSIFKPIFKPSSPRPLNFPLAAFCK